MVRGTVHLGVLHKERNHFQQDEPEDETHDGRDRKGDEDLLSLVPVDLLENGLSSDKGVRHRDADDRADVGVRGRVRHAYPPRAEVPPEGRHDQRQEERDLFDGVDACDHFIGQQVHQPEGHRGAARQDAEEIHERGESHRRPRLHGVGIDHRRDSVGGVVESVHGLLKHDQDEDEYQNGGGYDRQTCEELHHRPPVCARIIASCRMSPAVSDTRRVVADLDEKQAGSTPHWSKCSASAERRRLAAPRPSVV